MSSRQTIHYSVIVPAFRENGNIRPLVTRIFAALRRADSPVPAEQVEVIIVDDNSRDGSVENVQSLQQEGYNVRIVVRTTERGLSSAVVRGFQEGMGDNMLCMDADLQVRDSPMFGISLSDPFVAPSRIRANNACFPLPIFYLCPRNEIRKRRRNGQGLARTSTDYLCRCTNIGPSLDLRQRSHVWLLWNPQRICAHFSLMHCCPSHLTYPLVPQSKEP